MALAGGQTGHLADHEETVLYVKHGATASTARPTYGSASTAATVALWDGSVDPDNKVSGDFWWDTADDVLKRYDGAAWVSSGPTVPVVVHAGSLQATSQASARGLIGSRIEAWLMDGASTEQVRGATLVPSDWSTYDVYLWWANAGAGSGDAALSYSHYTKGDGGDATAGESTVSVTLTAAAQGIVKRSKINTTALTAAPGSLHNFRMARQGDAGSDTLTSDVGFIAIEFVKVS